MGVCLLNILEGSENQDFLSILDTIPLLQQEYNYNDNRTILFFSQKVMFLENIPIEYFLTKC